MVDTFSSKQDLVLEERVGRKSNDLMIKGREGMKKDYDCSPLILKSQNETETK